MVALENLQKALGDGIALMECELNPGIDLVPDYPPGEQSMSYAKIERGFVQALAVLVPIEPIDGVPCFAITFAVSGQCQRRGLAREMIEVAIAELRHGLGRNGIIKFYIEALVPADNLPAQKVASSAISQDYHDIAMAESETKAIQYLRLVMC
jgi:ribosomal protein S18 acetylase RimI-like enzyme